MITRFANLTSRMAVVLAMLFTVTACGGGGGGGDGGFLPDDSNSGGLFLALQLLDSSGEPTNTVTSAAPATLEVKVTKKNKNGAAVAGVVVRASSDIGAVLPGNALSNANGIATFQVEAGNVKGAGTISALAESEGVTSGDATLAFQVGSSGLRLGYFDDDGDFIENEIGVEPDGTLAASGNAQLTLFILDENGALSSTAESVRFDSGCIAAGQATLAPDSPVQTGAGRAATTYTATGCGGNDEITASLVGASSQAFATLSIAPPTANRLTFVSADPDLIVLKGTGGGPNRQEFSDVVFQAVDSNNNPLQGIEVDFSLTTFVGGLTVSPTTAISDADGNVKVSVFSGDVATVVRVIATTPAGDGEVGEVSTVSDVLSVSTGLPDQDSISLSVGTGFVVENGMTVDGIERTITVSMADKFNNPVPDGTAAVFTTELGFIESSCTTTGGKCSVIWTSSNPRFPILDEIKDSIMTIYSPGYSCPSHSGGSGPCPDDLGYTHGARSTVTVSAIGEESFIDRNGNGVMDQDERDLFDNVAEVHYDYNEDGIYNPDTPGCKDMDVEDVSGACLAGFEEEFVDFNSNMAYDLNDDPALYNGLLCPQAGDGVWCSRDLVNVRDNTVLILSADPDWDIALYRGSSSVGGTVTDGGPYTAYISDLFNSKPITGSTVNVTSSDCDVAILGNNTVPNTTATGAFAVTFSQDGEVEYDSCTEPAPDITGELTITLNPAKGGPSYSETYGCTVRLVDTGAVPCP